MQSIDLDFVDKIYEAAIIPEYWPAVLEQLCRIGDGYAAALLAFDGPNQLINPPGLLRYVTTKPYETAYASYAKEGLGYENVRPKRALEQQYAGFQRDLDLCSLQELEDDPIYQRFLFPYGIGWTAGTAIPIPTSDILVFDLCRRRDDGPFDGTALARVDPYRPHLARSAMLASRLGLERSMARVEALNAVGLPAVLVSPHGHVRAANPLFETLAPQLDIGHFDRVIVGHQPAADMLGSVLAEADTTRFVHSIPIPPVGGKPAIIAHVIPMRREARDIFAGIGAMIVATRVEAPRLPFADLLGGLFDLTPAESRLARAIAGGVTIQAYAATAMVSAETVRTQLKSVMSKTGTHRQTDLVRLLVATTPLGPSVHE